MRNLIYKIFLSFSLFLGAININAQAGPPPPPPNPEGGDIGGPATPIDNYIVFLVVFAIFLIAYIIKYRKVNS